MYECSKNHEITKLPDSLGKSNNDLSTTETTPIIFVTGAARSGTTMLARLLGAHSEIYTFNELHFFGDLVEPQDANRKLNYNQSVNLCTVLVARCLRGLFCNTPNANERRIAATIIDDLDHGTMTPKAIFAAVIRETAEANAKRMICEQTGRNIFYVKTLLELFPNSKIINIVRDPRAVLASQKGRWRMRRMGANHLPISEMLRNRVNYHPFTIVRLWIRAGMQAIKYSKHNRFLIIRYEDLIVDPKGYARRLCEFLNITYEPAMIDIPLWGSSNISHNGKKNGISIEAAEKWRENLSISEVMICEKMTKNLMQYFNYKPEYIKNFVPIKTIPFFLSFPLHALAVMVVNPRRAIIQLKALAKARQ